MGVWIEITDKGNWSPLPLSLPSWECGLKWSEKRTNPSITNGHSPRGSVDWNIFDNYEGQRKDSHSPRGSVDWNYDCVRIAICHKVTPLVGVWIEMANSLWSYSSVFVTPLVGVWIEIVFLGAVDCFAIVTPLVGVWIEIPHPGRRCGVGIVTPLVGVWIEMRPMQTTFQRRGSHSPRGSVDWNSQPNFAGCSQRGHSPRGSVDWNCCVFGLYSRSLPSLPSWECGLKWFCTVLLFGCLQSLPSWECGLKCWNSRASATHMTSFSSWKQYQNPIAS